jgi:HSP20 family molecular chaperone IbpA
MMMGSGGSCATGTAAAGDVKTAIVGDTLTLGLELPGIPKTGLTLEVHVDDHSVKVAGFRGGLFEREFSRVVTVDKRYDVTRAEAVLEDGFLTIKCPRLSSRVMAVPVQ